MRDNLIKNPSVGADPEMFLFSPKLNKFVPVCGLVGGTKDNPLPITDKGHAVQEDNVLIEYCIPPSATLKEFVDNIIFTKKHIDEKILKPLDLVSMCIASADFDPDDLQSPAAKHFGCTPDYNAWTYEENKVGVALPTLRTAGGHVHLGYADNDPERSLELIRLFDLFLGVPSIILDTDVKRRQMYGKAGAYRLKPDYGFEYRVLSTFWTDNRQKIAWVYNSVMNCIKYYNEGGTITNPKDIVHCINQADINAAFDILDDYNIEIPNFEPVMAVLNEEVCVV